VNFVKYAGLDQPMEAISKVRYKDSGALSTISQEGDKVRIDFVHNVKGIAPGQSAVFYEGNDLLGGGFLMK
jgi:tRNA-specific 2-thiouridylase